MSNQFDIAIVGAGIAGLTCAQQLQQAGYRVVVLEKSRGVGGRMATRRLEEARANHGARYLEGFPEQPTAFSQLLTTLLKHGIIFPWQKAAYVLPAEPEKALQPLQPQLPRYQARRGMSAIAKFLSQGLDIRFSQRLVGLDLSQLSTYPDSCWQLTSLSQQAEATRFNSTALVLAIPAPQAFELCEPLLARGLAPEFVRALQDAVYEPCIAAIAGYEAEHRMEVANLDWQTLEGEGHPILDWVGIEPNSEQSTTTTIGVFQSTAAFASSHFESDSLTTIGKTLLETAAQYGSPWLATPSWMQVHRWRYAFPKRPYPAPWLQAPTEQLLLCGGDWCGGTGITSAFDSGLAIAERLNQQYRQLPLPGTNFLAALH